MKRYIIPLSLAVMVMASCSVKEEQPLVSDGSHLVLTGFASIGTKVSVGEKDGETYPLLWYTGDAISIYSTDGSIAGEIATLGSMYSGSATGSFLSENDIVPASDVDLYVLYPSTLSYSDGVIKGTLSSTLTQSAGNSSDRIGVNAFAYSETSAKAGQTDGVTFSLQHKAAFAKVNIHPVEGYEDYNLAGLTFEASTNIAGAVSYSLADDSFTVSGASKSISVKIVNPSTLKDEAQAVYFACLPCDLTGTTVSLTISLEKDGVSADIPVEIDGGKLSASCLAVLDLTVTNDNSSILWYEPVDLRNFLAGETGCGGYAYGAANTFFIEQPASGYGSLTIDVKARGEYSAVKQPRYYALLVPSDVEGKKILYLPDGTDSTQETPTNAVSGDCTITVNCYSQAEGTAHWGTVGIYDEDYNLLWSFMICKYLEGDDPTYVDYGDGFKVLDRALGQPYSNKKAESLGTFDQPAIAYFQWGRKDPFTYNNPNGVFTTMLAGTDNTNGGGTLTEEDAIANPTALFYNTTEAVNWFVDGEVHLWGGTETKLWTEGDFEGKTVYDPCPEGYRVIGRDLDYRLISTGGSNNSRTDQLFETEYAEIWDAKMDVALYENPDSPFYADGQSVVAYKLPDGTYDYWPYAGFNWASGSGYADKQLTDCKTTGWSYWTCNGNNQQSDHKACMAYNFSWNGTGALGAAWKVYQNPYKEFAVSIRCQVDDE